MSNLVGLPAVSIVQANDMMARQQVKLLMQNCFSETDGAYEPVMLTMLIHRSTLEPDEDDNDSPSTRRITTSIQIPLITLLPINSLAIDEVDIEFEMDVHTHHELKEEGDHRLLGSSSASPGKSYELMGSINHDARDSDALGTKASKISVSFSTSKIPLPQGVKTIVQAYSQSIHPADLSQEQEND